MKKSLYLLSLSLSFSFLLLNFKAYGAFATKNSQGEIILKGGTCEELQKEVQALLTWSYKIKNKINLPQLRCRATSFLGITWGQEINISQVIPPLVSQYLGVRPQEEGPNCWNSTIVVNKISPYLRYSSDLEFNFWLNSPLCRLKAPEEERRPGDIVAIQSYDGKKWNEYHGFTYISDHLSFTKNGFSKKNPYQLTSTEDVFDHYQVSKNCRLPPHHPNCRVKANFYSCQSFDQYFALTPVQEELMDIYSGVNFLECLAQEMTFTGEQKTIALFIGLNLNILGKLLWDFQKAKTTSNKERFFIQALEYKLRSLRSQLSLFKKK